MDFIRENGYLAMTENTRMGDFVVLFIL